MFTHSFIVYVSLNPFPLSLTNYILMKFYAVLSFQIFRQARIIVFQQSMFSVNRMLYQYFTVLKSTLPLPLSLQVRVLLFRLLYSVIVL
jgi:hypothetical protein